MKKRFLPVALVVALATSMMTSSCIGSFALFNKLLAWNNQVSLSLIHI